MITDAVDEITIMYNKPVEHIPYENPMILPDESAVEVTEGEVSPPENLSESSADKLLTQRYLEWAKWWSDTHDNNYERYKVVEFLDSLGVDGLKELYFKGYFLNSITVTDDLNVTKTAAFKDWDAWKKHNQDGYDTAVTFRVEDNKIIIITENAGISLSNTAILTGIDKTVYAAITGDQVAITNIHIK